MDWCLMHFIGLKSGEASFHFLLSVERVVNGDTALLFVVAVGRLELGLLGLEIFIRIVVSQEGRD